jgi:anti-sigma regulatory factor (Ser/Thr protein kinase)
MDGLSPLMTALRQHHQQWLCPTTRQAGLYRTFRKPPDEDATWVRFGLSIQNAALAAGFKRGIAAQLVGAIGELQDNVYQHSQAPQTGLVVFRARPGVLEWVVCDSGIGVFRSLTSCPDYQHLTDCGQALRLALADGESRHGRNSGRGLGYHDLFSGLANLSGSLRFRSGDYALTIEGQDPTSMPAKLGQKTNLDGYLISVVCRC